MNEPLINEDKRVEKILNEIITDEKIHSKWLNLLSYLEFMGSRKIFKTQKNGFISESLLKHASDEARHALVLKQMIHKIQESENFQFYDYKFMVAPFSGYRYMQSLDSMVKNKLKGIPEYADDFNYICYVYMSFVIEVRANWLYAIYARLLAANKSQISLEGIINDEVRHLDQMKQEIETMDKKKDANIAFFLEKEKLLFERLLANLERSLRKYSP